MANMTFLRNVIKISLGTGAGQVITFAAAPFITRLYQPQDLGELNAVMAVVALLSAMATLSFPIAIAVAKDADEVMRLIFLSLLGCATLIPAFAIVASMNDGFILHLWGVEWLLPYVLVLPLLAFIVTLNSCAGYALVWNSAFGISSWCSVWVAFVGNSAKIFLGLGFPGTVALIVGNVLGFLVTPFAASRRQYLKWSTLATLNFEDLKQSAIRHRDFPIMRTPQVVLRLASDSLPVLVLTSRFDPATAGQLALAMAMLNAPAALFGNAIQSVFYPRIARSVNEGGNSFQLIFRATLGAFAAGFLPFVAIMVFGELLFNVVFGAQWREAGSFAAVMTPLVWSVLAGKPANAAIGALGIQKGYLAFEVASTAAKVIALIGGITITGDPLVAVGCYVAAGAFFHVASIVWVLMRSREKAFPERIA